MGGVWGREGVKLRGGGDAVSKRVSPRVILWEAGLENHTGNFRDI